MYTPAAVPLLSPLEAVRRLKRENERMTFIPDSPDNESYPEEIRAIRNRGFIVFAMTGADQKPFHYTKNGELAGVDVELAYAIANRLAVRASFDHYGASGADDVIREVLERKADIALSGLRRNGRHAETVRYTVPYLALRHALLLNRLEFARTGTEDTIPAYLRRFRGKLGVLKKTPCADYAAINFPEAGIAVFDTWELLADALLDGKLLAAYGNESEILVVNAAQKDAPFRLKPVFIGDRIDPVVMAVAADAPMLQQWLNLFIEEYLMRNHRELAVSRIVERHFGAGEQP